MGVSSSPGPTGKVRLRILEVLSELGSSFLFKVFFFCLFVSLFAAAIYSISEGVSFFEAFFVSLISILTEYGADPQTTAGKISVYVVMVTGLILFAFLIGEVSKHFLENFLSRGKVKVKKKYWGSDHFLILGNNSKTLGIIKELRSQDLEKASYRPIVILSQNVEELRTEGLGGQKEIYGIVGDPLEPEDLERAAAMGAHSILILSTDAQGEKEKRYSDARTALVLNTIKRNFGSMSGDKHVVMEFLSHDVNLLPMGEDKIDRPRTFFVPLQEGGRLVVEPIYMEKMPTYLFIQSLFIKEVNEVVQKLISTDFKETNEFYYMDPNPHLEKKTFFQVERALISSSCTPIGYLREEKDEMKLVLNPSTPETSILRGGDKMVVVSYGEALVKKAQNILVSDIGKPEKMNPSVECPYNQRLLPFKRLILLNWNGEQFRDILMELDRMLTVYEAGTIEIVVASPFHSKVETAAQKILEDIEKSSGRKSRFSMKAVEVSDPMGLEDMEKLGLTRDKMKDQTALEQTRTIALYGSDNDSDMRNLYNALLIENRIDPKLFTAVEVYDSKNYHSFINTNIDVVVSINQLCEKLLAQAMLKPYVSIIYRNLLTFSKDTNEFYLRDVPPAFVGRPVQHLRRALIGHPVIFLALVRPKGPHSIITINPKSRNTGEYDSSTLGRERAYLEDPIREGDKALLISYDPDCVDAILSALS
ncbi:MAG: ion channel [Candidatus Thermoplasmatota archaeon]|nr:ion channel [Candidatus Thermoplasmatota archaeon]